VSNHSRRTGIAKAESMKMQLGYPVSEHLNTSDSQSIDAYYSNLAVRSDDLFTNILGARSAQMSRQWQALGASRDLTTWETHPTSNIATHRLNANRVTIPAGTLQSPIFEADQPNYINYGMSGFIVSSELSHTFLSDGRYYSATGELHDWWDSMTSSEFDKIQQCISNQCSSTVGDIGTDWTSQTSRCDSSNGLIDASLVNAYRAWRSQFAQSEEDGREMLLPGLAELSRDQLFFIAFALRFASVSKSEMGLFVGQDGLDSSPEFRVERTLMNIPEFAETFQCPRGSKLNPPREVQCRLW